MLAVSILSERAAKSYLSSDLNQKRESRSLKRHDNAEGRTQGIDHEESSASEPNLNRDGEPVSEDSTLKWDIITFRIR